jgi:hypothetical protein
MHLDYSFLLIVKRKKKHRKIKKGEAVFYFSLSGHSIRLWLAPCLTRGSGAHEIPLKGEAGRF